MTYTPDKQRLSGWQWATDKANAESAATQNVDQYIEARMNEMADSYNAQRLHEAKEHPEIRALVEKLALVDKTTLADIEKAIDAAGMETRRR